MSGRILVVDDIATNRLILQAKLSAAYYHVLLAENGEEALRIAERELPDIILLDVMMPGIDGYTVCRRLKQSATTAHIPVVMVTAANQQEERIRGLEAGADDFLHKPINEDTLFSRVRNLMRVKMMFDELKLRETTSQELGISGFVDSGDYASDREGSVILATGDDARNGMWRACITSRFPYEVRIAKREAETLAMAEFEPPDAFIIAQNLAGGDDGLRLVSTLRANPVTRLCAILLVVEDQTQETAMRALDLGASDYICAPFDANEMAARLRSQMRRKKYSDRLRANVRDGLRMAIIDPLTGLYNRRYAMQHIDNITGRALKTDAPYAVMMLDLDHFKAINDRYGHAAGDRVLKEFARRLQANLRGIDLVARLGGEEFLVVMPDTDIRQARDAAERLRRIVEGTPFPIDDTETVPVTVSIGVALGVASNDPPADLIEQADRALYDSKHAGRNKVSYFADAA